MEEQEIAKMMLSEALRMNPQKRRSTRIQTHANVKIILGDHVINGELVNISLNGAFVIPDILIEINSLIMISILDTTTSRYISDVKAKVVSVIGNGIGLEFE